MVGSSEQWHGRGKDRGGGGRVTAREEGKVVAREGRSREEGRWPWLL